MGNSQTKEGKLPSSPSRHSIRTPNSLRPEVNRDSSTSGADNFAARPPRVRRGSRPDLSFLGLGGGDQDANSLETRRETKQEREARRLERERAARIKERERSMQEEHVDRGYLVTQGVYVGPEDYNKSIVRQLMVRKVFGIC